MSPSFSLFARSSAFFGVFRVFLIKGMQKNHFLAIYGAENRSGDGLM
jgi:hypothetical protein